MVKVLICGGGSGAHVMAGIAADQPGVTAHVLTSYADQAERWAKTMKDSAFKVLYYNTDGTSQYIGNKPILVTKDPLAAMNNINIVVLICPAFAHMQYLTELKPYVKPGLVLIGLPGQAGFEFAVCSAWGDKIKEVTLISFETLPWVCRVTEYGKSAKVLRTKPKLIGASHGGSTSSTDAAIAMLQKCIGPLPKLTITGTLLSVSLMAVGGCIHPSIMYGQWSNWDGKPLNAPPYTYTALTRETADLISKVSDEIVNIAKAIKKHSPMADLKNVSHVYDWLMRMYSECICDKSDLCSAFQTNRAYQGLYLPTEKTTDGKYLPNFRHRYMTENIPFGLVVMRGIASIAGVPTPEMDRIIYWAQGIMGKEYLKDGKLEGKDISETRAPQKFNLLTLDAVLVLNY